jgi:hypothetical protein
LLYLENLCKPIHERFGRFGDLVLKFSCLFIYFSQAQLVEVDEFDASLSLLVKISLPSLHPSLHLVQVATHHVSLAIAESLIHQHFSPR